MTTEGYCRTGEIARVAHARASGLTVPAPPPHAKTPRAKTSPSACFIPCPAIRTRGARALGPWWLEMGGLARSPAPHR